MSSGAEIRRRPQQTAAATADDTPKEDKPRVSSFLKSPRALLAFIVRNLPLILGVQVAILLLILLDPFGIRKERTPAPLDLQQAEDIKPLIGISDVERIAARVSFNDSVLLLVCPSGYTNFLENWLIVTSQHTNLNGKFLILAEDEETYTKLKQTYPKNTIYKMDVRDPLPDTASCSSPNKQVLEALRSAYHKVAYVREVLNAGHNVLLNDVTAVWYQSPYSHFVGDDVYLTLGDVGKLGGEQLLVDYPNTAAMNLQPPLPKGVGKLPPISDEVIYFQNNVGAWVTLDYWAVVIEGNYWRECNSTKAPEKKSKDLYTTGASTDALTGGVTNAVQLNPTPLVGLLPPGKFPPPTVFFEDSSWRALIEKESVIVRSKLGATSKAQMKNRLQQVGLWRVGDKDESQ